MLSREIWHWMAIPLSVIAVMIMIQGGYVEAGGPPKPYYAEYFSGDLVLKEGQPSDGLKLVACVGGCSNYQSDPVVIGPDSYYGKLIVFPPGEHFVGSRVDFYLTNEYGRVRALESGVFTGGFVSHSLNLTFEEFVPVNPGKPLLPSVGDPYMPKIPRVLAIVGTVSFLMGIYCLRRVLVGRQYSV